MTTTPARQADFDKALDEFRMDGMSIDGDNSYKRDLMDCITGAMAFGFQNTNPPPEGHWGKRFWDIGRGEGERAALAESELAEVRAMVDTLKEYATAVESAANKAESERDELRAELEWVKATFCGQCGSTLRADQ